MMLGVGIMWHPQTLQWWSDIWASPMASQWLAADVHALVRTAVLVNEFWQKPSPALLAEIRQQEQRFGLTPMDRQRLQWKIGPAALAAAPDGDDEAAAAAPPPPASDPRESLRLVK